jgi:phosphocarrier protein
MTSEEILIHNPSGLHLRPAGMLCREAMKYKSHITISIKGTTANAKSVLSVLAACVKSGDVIELTCEGCDEKEAIEDLRRFIDVGLEEL